MPTLISLKQINELQLSDFITGIGNQYYIPITSSGTFATDAELTATGIYLQSIFASGNGTRLSVSGSDLIASGNLSGIGGISLFLSGNNILISGSNGSSFDISNLNSYLATGDYNLNNTVRTSGDQTISGEKEFIDPLTALNITTNLINNEYGKVISPEFYLFFDSNSGTSIDWEERVLYSIDGFSLNWEEKLLSGLWFVTGLQTYFNEDEGSYSNLNLTPLGGNVVVGQSLVPLSPLPNLSSPIIQLGTVGIGQAVDGSVTQQYMMGRNVYFMGSWFTITSGTSSAMRFQNSNVFNPNAPEIVFSVSSSIDSGENISDWDSNSVKMGIYNNGSVGIGTQNNPTMGFLHVTGTIYTNSFPNLSGDVTNRGYIQSRYLSGSGNATPPTNALTPISWTDLWVSGIKYKTPLYL